MNFARLKGYVVDLAKPTKADRKKAKNAKKREKLDTPHLKAVRALPCIICTSFGMKQTSDTEAHHCKSGRYSQAKEIDRNAIPLCHEHHHGLRFDRDRNKLGFHNNQKTWELIYGPDHEYIAITLDMIENGVDGVMNYTV